MLINLPCDLLYFVEGVISHCASEQSRLSGWIAVMSDYKFSDAERWAVFTVHGDVCYMCRRPLDLMTMEIDHIVPERLLRDGALFLRHQRDLGLPPDFNINGFENWLPICSGCNKAKGARVFEPSLLIQKHLESARAKAARAASVAAEIPTKRQLARALGLILRSMDGDPVDPELLLPLIQRFAEMHPSAMAAVNRNRDQEVRRRSLPGRMPPMAMLLAAPELRLSPTLTAFFVKGGVRLESRTSERRLNTTHRFPSQSA